MLQADHLITRGNNATYAALRLVVCLCMSCHGWKSLGSNRRKAQYDEWLKALISPERVALWEAWRNGKLATISHESIGREIGGGVSACGAQSAFHF